MSVKGRSVLEAAPVAKGGQPYQTAFTRTPSVQVEPTIANHVGSRGRGLRLKQLAAIPKQALAGAERVLLAAGKEATVPVC